MNESECLCHIYFFMFNISELYASVNVLFICVIIHIKYKFLKKFHFPFDTDKFKLLRWSISKNLSRFIQFSITQLMNQLIYYSNIPIIKKQFFTRLNCSLGKNTYSVVTIHHHYFCITIGIYRMISKSYFIPFSCCVNDKI